MKLPDVVIDKLQDGESPVTHAAIIEGGEMIIRYTCDGKVIGQTMFHYTPETYVDWFRSMSGPAVYAWPNELQAPCIQLTWQANCDDSPEEFNQHSRKPK